MLPSGPELAVVTPDILEECEESARRVIAPAVTAREPGSGKALNLDAGVILDVLVYKTLIPIFVSVTSTLAARRIAGRDEKEQSLKDLRDTLRALIGQPVCLPEDAAKEELVDAVRAQLGQFADADTAARAIVDTVLRKLSERRSAEKWSKDGNHAEQAQRATECKRSAHRAASSPDRCPIGS